MNRIEKLLKKIKRKNAYMITSPIDIYYLTKMNVSSGILIVSHETCFFLVDGRYFEACKRECPVPVFLLKEGKPFDMIQGIETVIIDQDNTSYAAFINLREKAKAFGIEVNPQESQVKTLRTIKDPEEIQILKEASYLGLEGYDYVRSLLRPGIRELDAASLLEYFWRKKGAQGVAFEPIIAFGSNSAMPHHRAGEAILKEGDIVLIDIGVKWKHYHSDMTRVVFFGTKNSQVEEVHGVVESAIKKTLSLLRPGIFLKDLDTAARSILSNAGYGDFFTHSLGHGVGLEIHEYPLIKSADPYGSICLKEGMVITIEPGVYLPGIGGVRLEDTVIITKTGYENLTVRDYA